MTHGEFEALELLAVFLEALAILLTGLALACGSVWIGAATAKQLRVARYAWSFWRDPGLKYDIRRAIRAARRHT